MKSLQKKILSCVLFLLFGLCIIMPTDICKAESSAKLKEMNIEFSDGLSKQKNGLFTGTLTWDTIKKCSHYELYRSCEDKKEFLASVDDGNCQYTDTDLEYGKTYTYTVYAFQNIEGQFIKKYYSYEEINVKVSDIYRDVRNTNQVITSSEKVSLELTTNICDAVNPDYIEVLRINKIHSAEKRYKVKWKNLVDTRKKRYKDSRNYSFLFTDDNLKVNYPYEYILKPYIVLNGKKIYSDNSYTYTLASYNRIPSCSVQVTHNKKDNTFLVKLKNQNGNAPLMINSAVITRKQDVANPMELTALSYNGKNYIQATDSIYVFLQQNETIYMKFKGNDINKISFPLYFKYFYNPDKASDPLSDNISPFYFKDSDNLDKEGDTWGMTININKKSSKNKKLIPDEFEGGIVW